MYFAVGHNGLRLGSTDGAVWRVLQLGKEGETYRAAAFGAGVFVAVGSFGGRNITAATRDGTAWTASGNDAKYSRYFRGVVFARGQFMALGGDPGTVGQAKPFIATSPDGVQWSDLQEIGGKFILRRVAVGEDRLVGVGDRGRRAFSLDGVTWQDAPNTRAIDTLADVAFGAGRFVGVGLNGLRMSSTDGLAWSEPQRGEEGEHLNSIVWTGRQFAAIGSGATYFSPDGLAWQRQPNRNAPLTACYGGARYVGTHWKGRLLRSDDAVEWTEVHKAEHHLEAVCFGNSAGLQ